MSLSEAELTYIDKQRYLHKQVLVRKRLNCVYLKETTGFTHETIAHVAGVHPNQVGKWQRLFEEKGLAGICETNFSGPISELEAHKDQILASFEAKPPQRLAEARHRIEQMTGIRRDVSRVETFLKRHGYGWRKCGFVPGKADPVCQQAWVQEQLAPQIEAAREGRKALLFMDASHFVLAQFCCMMWCLQRVFIRSAAGRNRINVLGAYNAISGKLSTLINTTFVNAEVIMQFLAQLRQEYVDLPIVIVLDNAAYQHCRAVKAFAQSLQIELLFLPAYSPNPGGEPLNIIERLWRFAKRQILYGNYFHSPALFHQAIRDFFQAVQQGRYEEQLNSLITLKFQTFNDSRILAP